MRIAVLGYIVRGPTGGMAWHHLQYVLGLVRLGHDVRFVEGSDDYPACYNPTRYVIDTDPSYGIRFAADAFQRLGLEKIWSYHDAHTGNWLARLLVYRAVRTFGACGLTNRHETERALRDAVASTLYSGISSLAGSGSRQLWPD